MITYFTADPHFAHDRILQITARKFLNIEEHDREIIAQINKYVGENDRLIVLGDFAWHAEDNYFNAIKCKNKHLIIGNHDRPRTGKLFNTAQDTAIFKLKGHNIFCSHYPHAYWPSSHRGSLHLYGHVHNEREGTLDTCFPGRRSMDASVDSAFARFGEYRPFSEDEVIDILSARPGHDLVEWYEARRAARG